MIQVSLEQLRERVRKTRGPQFMLPARFNTASFDNYDHDPAFPAQSEALDQIQTLIAPDEPARSWLPWRRSKPNGGPRGLYLDGPPGVGKTHLLAAAFQSAPGPKLFATFDEFAAAAGTLGMAPLRQLLASKRLVCIDEIDLRDPANIMLLTSLVRAMIEGLPTILATANAEPTGMPGDSGYASEFARELGEIANAFAIVRIEGVDWRVSGLARGRMEHPRENEPRVASFSEETLRDFLSEVHPMYDAAWLQEVDIIAIDRVSPLPDTDRALRFVRFIDRVYDRAVDLEIRHLDCTIDDLLAPVRDDRRFGLHFIRCRSRLLEMTAAGVVGDD